MATFARVVELLALCIVSGTGTTSAPRQTNSMMAFGGTDNIVAIHCGSTTDFMTLILSLLSPSWILANLIVEELVLEQVNGFSSTRMQSIYLTFIFVIAIAEEVIEVSICARVVRLMIAHLVLI